MPKCQSFYPREKEKVCKKSNNLACKQPLKYLTFDHANLFFAAKFSGSTCRANFKDCIEYSWPQYTN